MSAAGERGELETRRVRLASQYLPLRLGGAAALEIDPLARLVLPGGRKRQVDEAAVALDLAPDTSDIVFVDLAVLERAAERTERLLVEGEKQQPRGVLVEPMDG